VVAALALRTGRPVKVSLTREEVFYCHRGRHPVLMKAKTGVKKDGSITALHFQSYLDGGGYGSYGVASTYYTGALQTVTYPIAHYRFDGARFFTNKPPCGPKRGHGTRRPRFALEVQLDKIAERLLVNPADLRLRHLVPPDRPDRELSSELGRWGSGRASRRSCQQPLPRASRPPAARQGDRHRCSSYICGAGLPIYWNAMPHTRRPDQARPRRRVAVFCARPTSGRAPTPSWPSSWPRSRDRSARHRLCVSDTDLTPVDLGSYSSRVTLMMGTRGDPGAERRASCWRRRRRPSSRSRPTRSDSRRARVRRRGPERGNELRRGRRPGRGAFGTIGRSAPNPPPSAGADMRRGRRAVAGLFLQRAVVELDVDRP